MTQLVGGEAQDLSELIHKAKNTQLRAIKEIFDNNDLSPSEQRHRVGNFLLLYFLDPTERLPQGIRGEERKELHTAKITGLLIEADIPVAGVLAESILNRDHLKKVYDFAHIPSGSPEIAEEIGRGPISSRSLDIEVLCQEALKFALPESE